MTRNNIRMVIARLCDYWQSKNYNYCRVISRETNIRLRSIFMEFPFYMNIWMCPKLVRDGNLDRLLTAVHRQTIAAICNYEDNQFDRDPEKFITWIVSSDKTWVYGYISSSRRKNLKMLSLKNSTIFLTSTVFSCVQYAFFRK